LIAAAEFRVVRRRRFLYIGPRAYEFPCDAHVTSKMPQRKLKSTRAPRFRIKHGLLHPARQVPSPNHNARPAGVGVDLLVIHSISLPPGEFGGPWIDALFTNTLDGDAHPYFAEICTLKVSSHLLIRRDGEVVQYVPFDRRAWHAGVSQFRGKSNCNDFSVGIELEGCDDQPYEAVQYRRLASITKLLRKHYPGITPERIAGHCDIAPERKTDPGPHFDWERYRRLIAPRGTKR
jgi:AmpD protein